MTKPCYSCPKGLMDGYITIHVDKFCRWQCFQGYGGCPAGIQREVIDIPKIVEAVKEAVKKDPEARIFLDAPNFLDVLWQRELPDEMANQHIDILKEIINQGIKAYLRIETSVESILPPNYYRVMRQAGVREIWLGVESGSRKLRDKYKKPSFENADLIKITRYLRKKGVQVGWYLVVGYEDSNESIDATERLIREAQPDRIFLLQLLPYGKGEQMISLGALATRIPDIEKYQAQLQKIAQELDEKLFKT